MSQNRLKALVIGCGSGGEGRAGYHSIGYAHADAYAQHPRTEIVAACDINADNLAKFQEYYGVAEGNTDLAALLERVQPDLVSICTFVGSHAPIFDIVKNSRPKGILMEKPFGLCMNDVRRMADESNEAGIKLAVNHFRRLLPVYAKVRELLDQGVIGDLQMITTAVAGWDQMEWGTHWLDMLRFFKHDQPVRWVFGQVQCSGATGEKMIKGRKVNYGHIVEEHSVNYFCFEDGTRALLDAGESLNGEATFSFLGTAGSLYLNGNSITCVNRDGLQTIDIRPTPPGCPDKEPAYMLVSVGSLVDWTDGGPVSPIAAANAVKSAELCLAAYESAVRRERINLPMGPQAEFPLNTFKP